MRGGVWSLRLSFWDCSFPPPVKVGVVEVEVERGVQLPPSQPVVTLSSLSGGVSTNPASPFFVSHPDSRLPCQSALRADGDDWRSRQIVRNWWWLISERRAFTLQIQTVRLRMARRLPWEEWRAM